MAARVPTTHRDMAAQHLQPGRVARLRSLPRREADVLPCPQQGLEGHVDPVDVAMVGNHDQRTASCRPAQSLPPRPSRPASQRPPADRAAPAMTPQGHHRKPHAAETTSRPDNSTTDQAPARSPPLQRQQLQPPPLQRATSPCAPAEVGTSLGRFFSAVACRGGTASRTTSPSASGIPVGNLTRQREHLWGENGLWS